jgi:hypothetical protein
MQQTRETKNIYNIKKERKIEKKSSIMGFIGFFGFRVRVGNPKISGGFGFGFGYGFVPIHPTQTQKWEKIKCISLMNIESTKAACYGIALICLAFLKKNLKK